MPDYFNEEQQAAIDELENACDQKAAFRELEFCKTLIEDEAIIDQINERIGVPASFRQIADIKASLIEAIRRAHTNYPHSLIKEAEEVISDLSDFFKSNTGAPADLNSLDSSLKAKLQAFIDVIRQESIR